MPEYDIDKCTINVGKHFRNKYMRNWNWDIFDIRDAIKSAYKVDKVGKNKYEIYAKRDGSKKIIFVYYKEDQSIFVISGAERK